MGFNCIIASHNDLFKKVSVKYGVWILVFPINILNNVFQYLSTCRVPCMGVLRFFFFLLLLLSTLALIFVQFDFVTLKDSMWIRVSSPAMYSVPVRNAFGE